MDPSKFALLPERLGDLRTIDAWKSEIEQENFRPKPARSSARLKSVVSDLLVSVPLTQELGKSFCRILVIITHKNLQRLSHQDRTRDGRCVLWFQRSEAITTRKRDSLYTPLVPACRTSRDRPRSVALRSENELEDRDLQEKKLQKQLHLPTLLGEPDFLIQK